MALTIDERLERLTERHEALAQSVEILLKNSEQDGENIRALARIAEIHERRVTHLEDRNS
jgi:hypothetical protein